MIRECRWVKICTGLEKANFFKRKHWQLCWVACQSSFAFHIKFFFFFHFGIFQVLFFCHWDYLKLLAWRILLGPFDAATQVCWAMAHWSFHKCLYLSCLCVFDATLRIAFSDVWCFRVLRCFCLAVFCALCWFSGLEGLRFFLFFFFPFYGGLSLSSPALPTPAPAPTPALTLISSHLRTTVKVCCEK